MKVKLTKLFHPNISISTTENGGRGTHFAKFLISPFQWGLTHSALMINFAEKVELKDEEVLRMALRLSLENGEFTAK